MLQRDKRSQFPPCALCHAESEVDCWQYALCLKCFALWKKEIQPPPENARWNPEANVRQAGWRAQTLAWLERAKKARAV